MEGLFITFEGPDGGGKTTQIHRAAAALRAQGYEVVESREPGGTSLAEEVRQLVLSAELPLTNTTQTLLFLAARSEHVAPCSTAWPGWKKRALRSLICR